MRQLYVLLLFYLFLFTGNILYGQEYQLFNQFTVKEGLPSNRIYDITEDRSGFLWITSDNGVARFDGKNFYLYTVKNGLPSNDVLQIIKDDEGTIWVNCYKELPSYFDPVSNSFVTITTNTQIRKICSSLLNYSLLPNKSIRFYGDQGFIDLKSKRIIKISESFSKGFLKLNSGELSFLVKDQYKLRKMKSIFFLNGKVIDSLIILDKIPLAQLISANKIFNITTSKDVFVYSDFKQSPFSYKTDTITLDDEIKWYKVSDHYFSIIAKSGTIYIYDKETLQLESKIKLNYQVNSAYIDHNKRLWIGTLDSGVLYYDLSKISPVSISGDLNKTNFLSIAISSSGDLFAGNYNAEVFKKSNKESQWSTIKTSENNFWIRKLILTQNHVTALSDAGYSIDLKPSKSVVYPVSKGRSAFKTGLKLNDSILIAGSINGLCKLNVLKDNYKFLNSSKERILNMVKKNNNEIYYVSAQGLFNYNYKINQYRLIPLPNEYAKNKPSTLYYHNELLWVATVKGDLLLLKNDKPICIINNEKGLPENISAILVQHNRIWIASKSGLYVVNYSLNKKKLSFTINKLSISDGLGSDVINDLAVFNDSIYAATSNGISIIPSTIKFEKFEINPTVISVTVNNKKMPLQYSYALKKDEKNSVIELSGVELSGHFKKFQYSFNGKSDWIDLQGATLNLSLKGGVNDLYVRAIDVNNNISKKITHLKFDVSIPFYNSIWSLILIVFALTGIVFWSFNQRKLNKQKNIFKQKMALEHQRSQIIADLHDDIGATLSSLQINSVVAYQLVEKKPTEAIKVLQKIEAQSKNLADKIGDIIWSMKPGKDEFMSMSTRVKNFANDILGATEINYTILIDKRLDKEITDFSTRKNIVLFIKEAVNNAAKYSQASQLNVTIKQVDHVIHICVEDNGVGFNMDAISGNGISNMKNRINELHGTFEIKSSSKFGTKVTATLPVIP